MFVSLVWKERNIWNITTNIAANIARRHEYQYPLLILLISLLLIIILLQYVSPLSWQEYYRSIYAIVTRSL